MMITNTGFLTRQSPPALRPIRTSQPVFRMTGHWHSQAATFSKQPIKCSSGAQDWSELWSYMWVSRWPSWAHHCETVPNKLYGLCRRKATLNLSWRLIRAQELCESRCDRPGLPVPNRSHGFCGCKATLNQTEFYTHKQSWRDISVATKGGI